MLIHINSRLTRERSPGYKVKSNLRFRLVKIAQFCNQSLCRGRRLEKNNSMIHLEKYRLETCLGFVTARFRPGLFAIPFCSLVLTACMHDAPPMLTERTAVVSGRATADMAPSEATQIVLFKAAEMTIDHGFRYFQIVGSDSVVADRSGKELIRPGASVTIRVYRQGEIDPHITGIIDAQDIAEHNKTRVASVSAQGRETNAAPSPTPPAGSG